MTDGPPGNRLYLVCQAHADVTDSLLLATRVNHGYTAASGFVQFSKWMERHKDCPGGADHFQLAHAAVPNWDQEVANEQLAAVAAAVKLSLVESKGE